MAGALEQIAQLHQLIEAMQNAGKNFDEEDFKAVNDVIATLESSAAKEKQMKMIEESRQIIALLTTVLENRVTVLDQFGELFAHQPALEIHFLERQKKFKLQLLDHTRTLAKIDPSYVPSV